MILFRIENDFVQGDKNGRTEITVDNFTQVRPVQDICA